MYTNYTLNICLAHVITFTQLYLPLIFFLIEKKKRNATSSLEIDALETSLEHSDYHWQHCFIFERCQESRSANSHHKEKRNYVQQWILSKLLKNFYVAALGLGCSP